MYPEPSILQLTGYDSRTFLHEMWSCPAHGDQVSCVRYFYKNDRSGLTLKRGITRFRVFHLLGMACRLYAHFLKNQSAKPAVNNNVYKKSQVP